MIQQLHNTKLTTKHCKHRKITKFSRAPVVTTCWHNFCYLNIISSKWNIKLAQGLRGTAYDVYAKLPTGQSNDYAALKRALLVWFELTSKTYRKKLRNSRRDKGESHSQFVDRLETYLRKWLALSNLEETFADLAELILSEQLRDSMMPETRMFTTEQGAESLADLIKQADPYTTKRKITDKPS